MTINEKFEVIIKILFNGNKRAFAKTVGISPTVVENVVGTRQGKPSYDVLVKVCSNANISAEWLLLGEEGDPAMSMFTFRKELTITAPPEDDPENSSKGVTTIFTKGKGKSILDMIPISTKGLPLIPLNALEEFLWCSEEDEYKGTEEYSDEYEYYIIPEFESRETDFLIRISGDSMQPHYFSGDILGCRKVSRTGRFFQWGRVYIIYTTQGMLIKRVEEGSTDEYITLVSENEQYKPFELSKQNIYNMALVTGILRSE